MDHENKIVQDTNENWPGSEGLRKGKGKRKILFLILAILLVVGSALGSFYLSKNLNQASVPNAPESQPQAAYTPKKTQSWNGGEDCKQGCGANEYCENGRCRKSGGSGDARSPEQVAAGAGTQLVSPTTIKFNPDTYECTPQNCPSPDFYCKNGNTCVNRINPNLSVANDAMNCGGKDNKCLNGEACIMGDCVKLSTYSCDEGTNCKPPYKCLRGEDNIDHCVYKDITVKPTAYVAVSGGVTPVPTPTNLPPDTKVGDPNNCNGSVCVSGFQYCNMSIRQNSDSTKYGVCVAIPGTGTELCNGVAADLTGKQSCCVPPGIGVDPEDASKIDNSIHWTNCAAGTSCRQGVGCIGTGTKTPDVTTNELTTVITTTTTITPSITTTVTPSITTTTTITPTDTITITPTPVSCNESCIVDSDCVSGLYCDATSKKCRKSECSTEISCVCPTKTPTKEPTIVGCNKRCDEDSNCMQGLVCDKGVTNRCRRPSCMSSSDCRCEREITTTRRPTEEVTTTRRPVAREQERLVDAGILDLPGAVTFGGGLILAIVGILLAL